MEKKPRRQLLEAAPLRTPCGGCCAPLAHLLLLHASSSSSSSSSPPLPDHMKHGGGPARDLGPVMFPGQQRPYRFVEDEEEEPTIVEDEEEEEEEEEEKEEKDVFPDSGMGGMDESRAARARSKMAFAVSDIWAQCLSSPVGSARYSECAAACISFAVISLLE